jgi:hypothetical protein
MSRTLPLCSFGYLETKCGAFDRLPSRRSEPRRGEASKHFFFEKKKQKTFVFD